MNARSRTHYEVLGVRPEAPLHEIVRAYQRQLKRLEDPDVPPDARLEAALKEAHDTLTDEARRDAYDRSLRAPVAVARRSGIDKRVVGLAIAGVAILGGVAYLLLKPASKPALVARPLELVQSEAGSSIGRLSGFDMSGQARALGVAFTAQQGTMTAVCRDVAPGMQLVVEVPPRRIPARIVTADDGRGFCTLAVDGGGSFPLPLSQAEPKAGDVVYVAGFDAQGALKLAQSKVKAVAGAGDAREFTLDAPLAAGATATPVLDVTGRVVAVADAGGRIRPIPGEWMGGPARAPARSAAPEPAAAAAPAAPQEMTPERRKALEEAFKPQPKVPGEP